MERIINAANELTAAFTQWDAYIDYKRLTDRLANDPALTQKIEAFYEASADFEQRRGDGEEVGFEEEKALSARYTDIWLNENGRLYMESRKKLHVALKIIFEIIERDCAL